MGKKKLPPIATLIGGVAAAFGAGAAASYVLTHRKAKTADAPSTTPAPTPVRDAGPEHMEQPPRRWDMIDQQADESFPASDPPGNY